MSFHIGSGVSLPDLLIHETFVDVLSASGKATETAAQKIKVSLANSVNRYRY